ncbi:mitochondrial fission 1 protein A-like isoform X2 [Camellia sinensis]|uniref:mitochondrial fission 1 protein A-like isoform X2 n=1 Tax=Camellia sinensis TaxID=4442 RepID=UPI00103564A5|nr:mitochondrial fission 1 protein A-like isoform X2 [Camellia sinensis]
MSKFFDSVTSLFSSKDHIPRYDLNIIREMWAVKRSIRNLCDSLTDFFSSGDHMPWNDPDTIAGCEREVAEAANGVSDELKSERIMRLSWALAHSKQPEDMQRGIAMLEGSCKWILGTYQYEGRQRNMSERRSKK